MNEFEIQQIQKAFDRCFGLQSSLQTNDKLLKRGAIESLSYQSGLRKDFIENNLQQILEL